MLYNNINTSTKAKKITDISNGFISEITKKYKESLRGLKTFQTTL